MTTTQRSLGIRLVSAAVVLAAAGAVAALAVPRPDPATQAQADGCGRTFTGLVKKERPTWVYVNDATAPADGPAPPPQWVSGVVSATPAWLGAHPASIEDPVVHDSFDFLINVKPDPQYDFLLGTGNFAADVEETGRLHTEWEERAFPSFAWPEPGDRVLLLGNWVWDCGHWLLGGERTELHPLRAVWIQRQGVSPRSAAGETEADLFISTDKTPAGASADCAHRTKGSRSAFKACLAAEPNRQNVNGVYRFNVVPPPRPSPTAKLHVLVVDAGSTPTAPPVKVVTGAAGPQVVVTIAALPGQRVVVAKQVFAGWDTAPRPVHLRVRFEQILVRRAMEGGCPSTNRDCLRLETTRRGQVSRPPGEWILYSDVAGVWTRWKLLRPVDGQTIVLGQTVDAYVRRGAPWRVFVTGRECDNGLLSAHSLTSPLAPCPRGTGEFLSLTGDDAPGSVVDQYASPGSAVGVHVSNAGLANSSCPPVNRQGCYQIRYSVTIVR